MWGTEMNDKTIVSGVSICMLGAIAIVGILKGSDGILNILVGAICTIAGINIGVHVEATKSTKKED